MFWELFCMFGLFEQALEQSFKTYPQVDPVTKKPYPKPQRKRLEDRLWEWLKYQGLTTKAAPWTKKPC